MKRLKRALLLTGVGVVLLVAGTAATGLGMLRGSLPRSDGRVAVPNLTAPVKISRDARGIPTIVGATPADVARGQGFVHAQDRYFQMDLTRRYAAAELAALFGEMAAGNDARMRVLQFRQRAGDTLAALPPRHRRLIDAYVEGVNAGLADLGARPPEYLLLRSRPEPWSAEDSVLVLYFFLHSQSLNHRLEKPLGVMTATLPPALVDFLTPDTSRFDVPLIPDLDAGSGTALLPVPGPEVVDLRTVEAPPSPLRGVVQPLGTALPGSNNWAVAGSRTTHGGAILANDPHLLLRVPTVWYRAKLISADGTIQGAGPAGIPGVVIGCSEHLAWGVTNSLVDQNDWVVIETDPADPTRYRTPEGWEAFDLVEGGAVRLTRWGPVAGEDHEGRPLALRSPMLLDGGADFGIFDIFTATTIEQAVEVLRTWRGPSLNWLIAQRDGRIGWVVGGYLPRRVGFTGKTPTSWADGSRRWDGELDETRRPVIIDPPEGVLFTANNRTVPTAMSRHLGHTWIVPMRAARIAELLSEQDAFSEQDLLDIQLDTRSRMHDQVREIVLEVIAEDETDERLLRLRRHARSWNGLADPDQVGFRIVARYYDRLQERVLAPLLMPAIDADRSFLYNWPVADEPMRRLLETRPDHLVPPGHDDWPSFLRAVLVETVELFEAAHRPGLDASWGEVNRAAIEHPIASAAPMLARWLNMPADPLPGSPSTVRVSTPVYGATLRMTVSPGHPEAGLFHMPAGQSGHPMSPHYRDGHRAWVEGLPTPFEPGPAVSSFTLE